MKGYLEMYLECSKEHGFKPDNLQEIVRYLLVNGHIHLTEENLALIGDREFFLGADRLPEEMDLAGGTVKIHEKLLKTAKLVDNQDWTLHDDHETEHIREVSTELEGVWIKDGRVRSLMLGITRVVKVYQTYSVPDLNEALFE